MRLLSWRMAQETFNSLSTSTVNNHKKDKEDGFKSKKRSSEIEEKKFRK